MTLADGLYYATILVGLLLDLPAAVILTRAALQKPHIWALTLFALGSIAIGLLVLIAILAVVNAAAGYIVPKDVGTLAFRVGLLIVSLGPPIFLWAYWTGKFRDQG